MDGVHGVLALSDDLRFRDLVSLIDGESTFILHSPSGLSHFRRVAQRFHSKQDDPHLVSKIFIAFNRGRMIHDPFPIRRPDPLILPLSVPSPGQLPSTLRYWAFYEVQGARVKWLQPAAPPGFPSRVKRAMIEASPTSQVTGIVHYIHSSALSIQQTCGDRVMSVRSVLNAAAPGPARSMALQTSVTRRAGAVH